MTFLPPIDQLHVAMAVNMDKWPAQPAMPRTLYLRESDQIAIVPEDELARKIKKVVFVLDATVYSAAVGYRYHDGTRFLVDGLKKMLSAVYKHCTNLEHLQIQPTVAAWREGWLEDKWSALRFAITEKAPEAMTLELPVQVDDRHDN